jgi:hypothetical protein
MQVEKLSVRLKTSLDELRMQVLGAQVLLGFQFQSLFQERFALASIRTRIAATIGLIAICLSLAGLIAAPAQHRLVEKGDASIRILRLANRCAEISLGLLALALGCDVFVTASLQGSSNSIALAIAAVILSLSMWFGVGLAWSGAMKEGRNTVVREEVDIHGKIEQMLTEARVILPGAQAMLGFQLVVTLANAFNEMVARVKLVHFVALGAVILSVVLLIAPAAVHRLSFAGRDDARFHRIGSGLITAALVPLAAGIALDLSVAAWQLAGSAVTAMVAGGAALAVLMGLWYVWPLSLRLPNRKR